MLLNGAWKHCLSIFRDQVYGNKIHCTGEARGLIEEGT